MSDFETREVLLLDALQAELADKPITARFTARELAMIDQLHTRGYAATVELARDAGITSSMRVLDLGCGLGGPARLPRRDLRMPGRRNRRDHRFHTRRELSDLALERPK